MAAEVDPTGLFSDRALLGRSSTADRVADILRARIAEGYLPPGSKLGRRHRQRPGDLAQHPP